MATKDANATRPKSKAKAASVVKPVEWVQVRISKEANEWLTQLQARRALNNRIASKPTIVGEAIRDALRLEIELMRANVNQIQKRVGGSQNKITS